MEFVWEPSNLLLDLLRPQDARELSAPATFAELFDLLETGEDGALPTAGNSEEEAMEAEVGERQEEDPPEQQQMEQGREQQGGCRGRGRGRGRGPAREE